MLEKQIEIIKRQPIPEAVLHESLSKLKGIPIYLVTNVKLTLEERATAKVLMVVGQTGSGKTTLLNALVNYHMGIQFNDEFRYAIIAEDQSISQSESQTS